MMNDLIKLITDNLNDSFLNSKYINTSKRNKFTGHCYVATEALYYLMNNDEKLNYKPATLKINNDTHWFLRNITNGDIIDLTKEQFNFNLDYTHARNTAFLTKTPSKRTLRLINIIHEKTCL